MAARWRRSNRHHAAANGATSIMHGAPAKNARGMASRNIRRHQRKIKQRGGE